MNYKDRKEMFEKKKKKKIINIFIGLFLIILPILLITIFIGYNKFYEPYIEDSQVVEKALKEAKSTNKDEISSNVKKINQIKRDYNINSKKEEQKNSNNKKEINTENNKAKASQVDNELNDLQFDEEKDHELYEETGITYNFNQVEEVGSDSINEDLEINRNLLVGQILIPDLNMNLPLLEGVSNENLYTGASTMKPNQELGKGNYALAGHLVPNENLLFSPLQKAKPGQRVYITDKAEVYIYEIEEKSVVSKNSINVISDNEGDGLITLVTCSDLYGSKRVIVRGYLLEKTSIDNIDEEIYKEFNI